MAAPPLPSQSLQATQKKSLTEMPGGKMPNEMFDDYTLPIKFNLAANDDAFEKLLNGNISNEEWSLDIDDFYADLFYQLDINVFVEYEDQSKIDLFGPLITDMETLTSDDYIVVDDSTKDEEL